MHFLFIWILLSELKQNDNVHIKVSQEISKELWALICLINQVFSQLWYHHRFSRP